MRLWRLSLLSALCLLPNAHGTCFGTSFETLQSSFQYQAYFQQTDCDLSNTNVTTLYMLGACCKQRMNNFGPEPPSCGPGDWNIMNTSASTCETVFAEAQYSHDVRKVHGTQPFDMGEVCSDGIYGVIFVQTDCSSLNASSVVLKQRPGRGQFCWSGHTLSRGALAGIVVACIVGVGFLVALPVAICWWRWRRQQRLHLKEAQSSRSEGPLSCQIVKVSDSVFVSKPTSRQPSLYASRLLEEDTSQAYDIELESQTSIGSQTRDNSAKKVELV